MLRVTQRLEPAPVDREKLLGAPTTLGSWFAKMGVDESLGEQAVECRVHGAEGNRTAQLLFELVADADAIRLVLQADERQEDGLFKSAEWSVMVGHQRGWEGEGFVLLHCRRNQRNAQGPYSLIGFHRRCDPEKSPCVTPPSVVHSPAVRASIAAVVPEKSPTPFGVFSAEPIASTDSLLDATNVARVL